MPILKFIFPLFFSSFLSPSLFPHYIFSFSSPLLSLFCPSGLSPCPTNLIDLDIEKNKKLSKNLLFCWQMAPSVSQAHFVPSLLSDGDLLSPTFESLQSSSPFLYV